MLKWIEIIASFFIGKMQTHQGPGLREQAIALFEEITFMSRKAVSLIVISFAAAIFALGGFFISLINATTQYDRDGAISFSSTFVSGLVLIAIAVGAFAWVFGSAWPGTKKFKGLHKHGPLHTHHEHSEHMHHEHHERPMHQPSSLEQALSALVMDFVKERELRRSESAAAMNGAANEAPDFRATNMTPMNTMSGMPTGFENQEPIH